MLILSRKIGERVVIGTGADAVVIEVVGRDRRRDRRRDSHIRLGVTAPRNVTIIREELLPIAPGQEEGGAWTSGSPGGSPGGSPDAQDGPSAGS